MASIKLPPEALRTAMPAPAPSTVFLFGHAIYPPPLESPICSIDSIDPAGNKQGFCDRRNSETIFAKEEECNGTTGDLDIDSENEYYRDSELGDSYGGGDSNGKVEDEEDFSRKRSRCTAEPLREHSDRNCDSRSGSFVVHIINSPTIYHNNSDCESIEELSRKKGAAHGSAAMEIGAEKLQNNGVQDHSSRASAMASSLSAAQEEIVRQQTSGKTMQCPRCESYDTKFCYFNNYNVKQPRYFCRNCQRYWTAGGSLRNVPVGSGRRRTKAGGSNSNNSKSGLDESFRVADHAAIASSTAVSASASLMKQPWQGQATQNAAISCSSKPVSHSSAAQAFPPTTTASVRGKPVCSSSLPLASVCGDPPCPPAVVTGVQKPPSLEFKKASACADPPYLPVKTPSFANVYRYASNASSPSEGSAISEMHRLGGLRGTPLIWHLPWAYQSSAAAAADAPALVLWPYSATPFPWTSLNTMNLRSSSSAAAAAQTNINPFLLSQSLTVSPTTGARHIQASTCHIQPSATMSKSAFQPFHPSVIHPKHVEIKDEQMDGT